MILSIGMSENRDEYIKMYNKFCLFDDTDFSHEELSKIAIGCITNNTEHLQDLKKENAYIDIIDYLCMKLILIPKYTHHIRMLLTNLETIKELFASKRVELCETIMILFTMDEIKECIF